MIPPELKHWLTLTGAVSLLVFTTAGVAITACATPTYRVEPRAEAPVPVPETRLYFYPTQGQSQAQQDRDRYECHLWAVKKSGYDPGLTPQAPHQRVEVVSQPPPGVNTAAGAVGGAVVGSLLTGPRRTGEGMVLGAIAGAMLGATADATQHQQTQKLQRQYDNRYAAQYAKAERQAGNYQRAMTACLEGRDYSVR